MLIVMSWTERWHGTHPNAVFNEPKHLSGLPLGHYIRQVRRLRQHSPCPLAFLNARATVTVLAHGLIFATT